MAFAEAIEEMGYELINGEEIMMSPAGRIHNKIQGNLFVLIGTFLKGKRCQAFFETYVFLDEKNKFVPDISIVCDPDKVSDRGIEGAPDFVAEVLSLSTQHKDKSAKKYAYEKFGVKEYWIIDPKARSIEVYLLGEDGKYILDNVYQEYTEADIFFVPENQRDKYKLSLKLSLYEDLEIKLADIFENA